ncbi:hypothetical protein FPCIR_13699 [Fusarium pseudocircinatum]|uniref:Transcription factor domain-containing protein n=1 Tax=Fusarium pseudocircinatum TaxID=56676 RepID=A0A8H5KJ49_9HYPO|nr:hypothetical protein FPCIR_13699 [Fusarium pseudocircinatum]
MAEKTAHQQPPSPVRSGMRHNEDIRCIVSTFLFFLVFVITWHYFSSPLAGGWVSLTLWLSLFQLSFMGAVTTHNAIHLPVFWSRNWNNFYQICLSLQYGGAVTVFIPGHNLSHHKYPQQARDVMRTTKVRYSWNLLNGLLFFWHVVLSGNKDDKLYFEAQARLNRPIVRQRRREEIAVWGTTAVLILIDWRRWIWFALLPQFYAKYCILSLNFLQHDGCDMSSKYNFARNFTGITLNYLCFNNGYHTVHHLYPGLHWSVLPEKHQELIGPHIAKSLESSNILVYMWKSFIYPGLRLDYKGRRLVITKEENEMPDEPWFYDGSETFSNTKEYLSQGCQALKCFSTSLWPYRQLFTPGNIGAHENPMWHINKPLGMSGKLKDIEASEKEFDKQSQQYNTTESRDRLKTLIIGVKSIEKAIDRQTEQQKKLNEDESNRLCLRVLYTTNPLYDKERIEEEKGDRLDETTPGLISCFFYQATRNHQNSATAVLRGIIWSLAHQHPALVSHVRSEFDSAGEQAFNGPNNWEILSSILRRMISDGSNRVPDGATMVLDALDEFTKDNKKLLNLIMDLCANDKSQVRWIVSSRNWVEFQDAFMKKTIASQRVIVSLEDNEEAKESINKAVDAFIEFLSRRPNSNPRRILQEVKDSSHASQCRDILAVAALVHHKLAKEFIWEGKKEKQVSESILRSQHSILIAMLETMKKTRRYDIHDLRKPGAEVPSFDRKDASDPLTPLKYACCYWADHISIFDDKTAFASLEFLKTSVLYWLEACSLLGKVPIALLAIQRLKSLASGTEYRELISVLRDVDRFALYFKPAIEQFPLQTYASGLFFSPRTSLARQAFKKHTLETSWLDLPTSEDWSACVQTLEGHTSTVTNMAFSGNGQCITIEQRLSIGPEIQLSFSSDSQRVLLGSEQPGIRDIVGRKWTAHPEIHPERLLTSAFSSDGTWVEHAFGEHGHSIWRFSEAGSHRAVELLRDDGYALPPSGQYPAVRPLPTSQRSSAISNDGKQVATCTENPFRLAIADTTTGTVVFADSRTATEAGSGLPVTMAWSTDSQWLAVGGAGDNGHIGIWDPKAIKDSSGSSRIRKRIRAMAFSTDGQIDLRLATTFHWSMAFSTDDSQFAFVQGEHIIEVHGLADQSVDEVQSEHVSCLALSPDGLSLAAGDMHGNVKVWDLRANDTPESIFESNRSSSLAIAYSSDGKLLAQATSTGEISLWQIAIEDCLLKLKTEWQIEELSFGPDDRSLMTGHGRLMPDYWPSNNEAKNEGIQNNDDQNEPGNIPFTIEGYGVGFDGAWLTKDGERIVWPCNGCIRSGHDCEFPATADLDDWRPNEGASPIAQSYLPSNEQQIQEQQDESMTSRADEEISSFQHEIRSESLSLGDSTGIPITSTVHQVPGAQITDEACQADPFYILDDEPTVSPNIDIPQPFNVLPGNPAHTVFEDTFALSPSSMLPGQTNFRTGGFDWLNFDIGNSPQGFQLDTFYNSYIPEFWSSTAHQAPESGGPSTSDTVNGVQHKTGNGEPTRYSQDEGQPDVEQNTLAWPFDQAHKQSPRRYQLPPLRDILNGYCPTDRPRPVKTTLVKGFIQILSENPLPQLETLRDPHSIQAFCSLQRLVDSYFSRFHDIQAIIHKPTWTMSACPPILLTAMASVGALVSDSQPDYELSVALSEICSTMINWMGASDVTNYSDVSYLNALCLYQIYSLGSGKRQLYQNADRSRGLLIGGLRGIGLLNPRSSITLSHENEISRGSEVDHVLANDWKNWIKMESGRRAAWAAFEYDCSLCTLTSRRGIVDLSELPSELPCPESMWNASSARAWFALMSRLGHDDSRPNLSKVLKQALAGRELPSSLGSWAKRLCAQVIGRLLWDLWQIEVVAMPEYLGLGSIVAAHQDTKRSLLKGLNNLVESLSSPSSTSDLTSYNIASLLCHYSHLCAANGVLDLILSIVRGLISTEPRVHDGIKVARNRLKLTFARDPKTARRLCWHAAQIVAIANEYLVSAPCEIMRVFMGYIFIIAYSAYGDHTRSSPMEVTQSVRLDLHDQNLSHRRVVVKWIEVGGPASSGSVPDIGADGCVPAISTDAQEILKKLQCWGLAHKFTKVFQVLETKGL